MTRGLLILLAIVMAWPLGGPAGAAEKFPTKPITFVVPWGAGGMTDVSARLLAEKFKAELGQPVLVVNKPGANGAIGLRFALGQKADGYHVVLGPMTDAMAGPYFLGGEPFDFKDLSFVAGYMPQQRVLFTTADKPYKTFPEFIEYTKKHPGELSAGSGGAQWALEVIKSIAVKNSLKMKYVMFKSGGEASTAILGKHVDLCETGTGTPAFQSAREGKLVMLVNLGSGSVPYFPQVKNMEELGYPFSAVVEYGFTVRAGTPEEIRKKLEDTLRKVMNDPDVKSKLETMGLTPRFTDGKQYGEIVTKAVKSVPELIQYSKRAE